MSILITSDLHLDSNPENEYRWEFLDHLKAEVQSKKITDLCILGDFTDKKDCHDSVLVNRAVEYIEKLATYCKVHILRGNHDCNNPDMPFFKFLNQLSNVEFYVHPTEVVLDDLLCHKALFLPHSRTPVEDWKDLDFKGHDFIFMHQTITGAKASNGFELEGLSTKFLEQKLGENSSKTICISGDIHLPQKIGSVIYVGAAYDTRFSDGINPRYFIFDGELHSVPYNKAPKKVKRTIIGLDELEELDDVMRGGDMLKIDLKLPKSEWVHYNEYVSKINDFCDERGIVLKGVKVEEHKPTGKAKKGATEKANLSKQKLFEDFCSNNKLDKYRKQVGQELLE